MGQSALLNNTLALMASDSNRNLRHTSDPSVCVPYEQAEQAMQEAIATLDASLVSDNECTPSLLAQRPVPSPAPDLSKSKHFALLQVHRIMRQMAWEEAERRHASHVNLFLSRAAEKALSDAFLASNDVANDAWRTSPFHFVMHTLTKFPATGGLNKIFHHIIEPWTQSSMFIDNFVRRALISSQFVPPVAKFIQKNV